MQHTRLLKAQPQITVASHATLLTVLGAEDKGDSGQAVAVRQRQRDALHKQGAQHSKQARSGVAGRGSLWNGWKCRECVQDFTAATAAQREGPATDPSPLQCAIC